MIINFGVHGLEETKIYNYLLLLITLSTNNNGVGTFKLNPK